MFVVVAHPRSGSTVLCSAIAQRASVSLEPFNPTWPAGERLRNKINPSYRYPRNIDELECWIENLECDGFKLQTDCFLDDRLNSHIVMKYKPIFIYRRDLLYAALSSLIASMTGKWQQYGSLEEHPNDEQLYAALTEHQKIRSVGHISIDVVEDAVRHLIFARDRVFRHIGSCQNPMVVAYEDLYCDSYEERLAVINRVMDYLGLDRLQEFNLLRTDAKLTDYSVIENFDEITAELGPRFADLVY